MQIMMKRYTLAWFATGTLCCAMVTALAGCGEGEPDQPAGRGGRALPVVEVAPVQQGDLARQLALTGEVVARQQVIVSPTVEGPIASIPWQEGDRVERGQVLVTIDRPLYQAERDAAAAAVRVAEAQLDDLRAGTREEDIAEARATVQRLESAASFAEADWRRMQRLVEADASPAEALERSATGHAQAVAEREAARQRLKKLEAGPTPTAVATAEAQVAEAAARVHLAEARLAECRITAPFDGVISRRHLSVGDMASPREPLLEMYAPASMVVRFAVPEWAAGAVAVGQSAQVSLDALGPRSFEARVVRVFTHLEQPTRTRTVEAAIDDEIELLPGMFARLELTLELASGVLFVPTDALFARPGEGRAVMVVRDGKAERVPVTVGIQQQGRSQVFANVEPDEAVIVFGQEGLRPGAAVQVHPSEPAASTTTNAQAPGATP